MNYRWVIYIKIEINNDEYLCIILLIQKFKKKIKDHIEILTKQIQMDLVIDNS